MTDERLTDAERRDVERLLAGELDAAARRQLERQAQDNPHLAQYVRAHDGLTLLDEDLGLPTDAEFSAMRRRVMREVRPRRWEAFRHALQGFFTQPALAGATALLLVGALGLGWWVGRDGRRTIPGADAWISELGETAQNNYRLADVESSPWLFSNVDMRKTADEDVELRFDVTRRVTLLRDRDDPLVAEALAQSMLNESQAASRLRTLRFAEGSSTPKVRQALIFAMLNDPEPAVRLRAQSVLVDAPPSEDLDTAFSAVLASEESVQMRMVALDYLAGRGEPEELRDLVRTVGDEEPSVLLRAAERGILEPR